MSAAISMYVLAVVLFYVVGVAFQVLEIDRPSVWRTIHALFFIVLPFRVMKLLYFRMWKYLVLENMDLNRKFQLVPRESVHNNKYHQWVLKFRCTQHVVSALTCNAAELLHDHC